MRTTHKDYTEQIRSKIPLARDNDKTGFLTKPSPAQLRNYCLHLMQSGLSESDKLIFKSFFGVPKNEENLSLYINQIDIDKFRPIQNFLEEKIINPTSLVIEMTAILIDFENRPYANFQKQNLDEKTIDYKNNTITIVNETFQIENTANTSENNDNVINKFKRKILVATLTLSTTIIAFLGFNFFKNSSIKTNCMQWQSDHYEVVDCNKDEKMGFIGNNPKEIYNEELFKLRKIEVDENTTFFVDNKAVVFYIKVNDSTLEFYNAGGFHPISGKPLKPITKYIIKKYILD